MVSLLFANSCPLQVSIVPYTKGEQQKLKMQKPLPMKYNVNKINDVY